AWGAGRAGGALGDHALPALSARLREERLARLVAVRRQPEPIVEGERAAQQPLARAQRQIADVLAVEPEDVERVEEHRDAVVPPRGEAGVARGCSLQQTR